MITVSLSRRFVLCLHYTLLFAPAAARATGGSNTPGFGFLTTTQPPRQIQFSLKLSY